MSKARRPKTANKGVAQAAPALTPLTAEEANEQNKAQILRQKNQGQELQDYYCAKCRKLEPKAEMTADKEGYYSCKECK